MNVISRVGVDLAKQVIQMHALDAAGKIAANGALAPVAADLKLVLPQRV